MSKLDNYTCKSCIYKEKLFLSDPDKVEPGNNKGEELLPTYQKHYFKTTLQVTQEIPSLYMHPKLCTSHMYAQISTAELTLSIL
jgi:hypothetical protein